MIIRKAKQNDYDSVWEIFKEVIKTGDTYVFDPNTSKSDMQKYWFALNMHTYVLENEDKVLGTYFLRPNQVDLGNHIANGAYMVHPEAQNQGIGKKLCEHSLIQAKELGFKAMQFNFVVSANKYAVQLWKNYGFEVIGTIPKAFRHQKLGLVAVYIMYKEF